MRVELNGRAQHLLKILVEHYIREGQPVGSRVLARASGLNISSATVRNVMAELETLGYVSAPHTSAGRVPTDLGYRVFVDLLLQPEPVGNDQLSVLQQQFGRRGSLQDMASAVSEILSGITHMAGLVMLPRRRNLALQHIEFLSLSEKRVLAILVTNDGEVHNTMVHTERDYGQEELQRGANYLNALFAGKSVEEVRAQILEELRDTRERMDDVMAAAIRMAEKIIGDKNDKDDIVLSGQVNLMGLEGLSRLDKLRELFEEFTEKRQILHLLDQSMSNNGVQIYIGKESGYQVLDECSIVTSTYRVGEETLGVLGVIGPTRMAYQQIIPLVDVTARLVSSALNQAHKTI